MRLNTEFANKHRAMVQVASAKAIAYGAVRHRDSCADSQMTMFHEASSSNDGASIRQLSAKDLTTNRHGETR
jgi:hypothetical protein